MEHLRRLIISQGDNQFRFYSIGKCIHDLHCAVETNLTSNYGGESEYKLLTGIPASQYNFQTCRRYPTGGKPDLNDASKNGCMCDNVITSSKQIVDANGDVVAVKCVNVDAGSISFFTCDAVIALLCFIIGFRALYIFLLFFKQFRETMMDEIFNFNTTSNPALITSNRKRNLPPIKKHSLICLFYLFLACFCFAAFRIVETICFALGIVDKTGPYGMQAHLAYWRLWALNMTSYVLLEFCTMHFSILWMSATPLMYADEMFLIHGNIRCFKPKYYKTFIYTLQILMVLGVIIMFSTSNYDLSAILIIAWIAILYQFAIGCKLISKMLTNIAKKAQNLNQPSSPNSSSSSSNPSRTTSELSKRLMRLVDKIDKFSRHCRIVGSLLLIFYALSVYFIVSTLFVALLSVFFSEFLFAW